MLPRDVLLTLAAHEFFSPKWSPKIRAEWTRNLLARIWQRSVDSDAQKRVERIVTAMNSAFPDAEIDTESAEPEILEPVESEGSPRCGHSYCRTGGRDRDVQCD
jgi:hypothetical protein